MIERASLKTLPFLLILCLMADCSRPREFYLVWSDEFDQPQPDTAKWGYDTGNGCPDLCGWGNNERQHYTSRPANVRIENGNLVIEAHLEDSTYTSGKVTTRGKAQWKYGRIEVRARLPEGRGTWPAIWMLPAENAYGGWPRSGEIDIMEHVGHDLCIIHGTLHSEKYNHLKGTQQEGTISVPACTEAFHVYAIEWSDDRILFFADETRYHEVVRSREDDHTGWPFDKPFYLILNLAVGGNWGGAQGVDDSIWPRQMTVDYVRIYQR